MYGWLDHVPMQLSENRSCFLFCFSYSIENYDKPTTQAKVATTPINEPPFNLENVQEFIAEIHPFLKEHGGNVKVDHVDEENRNVDVTLEGQCATCPMATTTLQGGIEGRSTTSKQSCRGLGQVMRVEHS